MFSRLPIICKAEARGYAVWVSLRKNINPEPQTITKVEPELYRWGWSYTGGSGAKILSPNRGMSLVCVMTLDKFEGSGVTRLGHDGFAS